LIVIWGYVGHVEPHELECPLGDPSCGETVPDIFFEPKRGYQMDRVALEIMHELVFVIKTT
jgi:hypothetical protein